MDWKNKWKVIEKLPSGAQADVYSVINNSNYKSLNAKFNKLFHEIRFFNTNDPDGIVDRFIDNIPEINRIYDLENLGVLKVLKRFENDEDNEQALGRMQLEIDTLMKIEHSNLLTIIDHDSDHKWFVSEYYPNKTLKDNINRFVGKPLDVLNELRNLILGVEQLHKNGIIHRDIKPDNIFVNSEGNLILGDFGIIYKIDNNRSRLTRLFANVGNWDYEPEWATGRRVEDLRPNFDVFSLGKLIWRLISGRRVFRLWYFDKEENNLETIFPDQKFEMGLINELLSLCVVENEKDCEIGDATKLLTSINYIIDRIENKYVKLKNNLSRLCQVCGIGHYEKKIDEKTDPGGLEWNAGALGIKQFNQNRFIVCKCSYCGHIQFFHWVGSELPDAWKNRDQN